MSPSIRTPKAGSLRYPLPEGGYAMAQPEEAMYSSVAMCATEVYTQHGWEFIFPDDPTPQYEGPPAFPSLVGEPPTLTDKVG